MLGLGSAFEQAAITEAEADVSRFERRADGGYAFYPSEDSVGYLITDSQWRRMNIVHLSAIALGVAPMIILGLAAKAYHYADAVSAVWLRHTMIVCGVVTVAAIIFASLINRRMIAWAKDVASGIVPPRSAAFYRDVRLGFRRARSKLPSVWQWVGCFAVTAVLCLLANSPKTSMSASLGFIAAALVIGLIPFVLLYVHLDVVEKYEARQSQLRDEA